jgi:hypothetical protein
MKLPIWLRLYFLFVLAQALLVGSAIIRPTLITVVAFGVALLRRPGRILTQGAVA